MEHIKLSYQVPITNSIKDETAEGGSFLIEGTAINVGVTANKTNFLAEELKPAAKTLQDKPLLKDHNASVDSIVGRTTKNVSFSNKEQAVLFEARVEDEDVQEKINKGLINTVSVGAFVERIEEETDDDGNVISLIVRGIEFVELSLVPVPADAGATFGMAIAEAYNHQGTKDIDERKQKKLLEATSMAEQEEKTKLETLREESAKLEEEIEALRVEKLKAEKDKLVNEEGEAEAEGEPTEEPASEAEPAEEPEEAPAETKGETTPEEPTEEETSDYLVEQGDTGGLAITPNYASEKFANLRGEKEWY